MGEKRASEEAAGKIFEIGDKWKNIRIYGERGITEREVQRNSGKKSMGI